VSPKILVAGGFLLDLPVRCCVLDLLCEILSSDTSMTFYVVVARWLPGKLLTLMFIFGITAGLEMSFFSCKTVLLCFKYGKGILMFHKRVFEIRR